MLTQKDEENIRVAAYYIWEKAGRPEGQEKECWIKACEQLFAGNSKSSSKKACATKSVEKAPKKACSSKKACASKAAEKPVKSDLYAAKKK